MKIKVSKWLWGIFFSAIILFVFRIPVFEEIGSFLVFQDELEPSDAIVVLAGSYTGNRIEEAVRIFDKGMGKVLVFSGYSYYPGMDSHRGMKEYAIKLGVPDDKIIAEKATGEISTWGEALANIKLLERLKAKSLILVTSSFHTRRSHLVYERAIKSLKMDITLRVQPAYDPTVPYPRWWETRSGIIKVFLEYIKLFYYFIAY